MKYISEKLKDQNLMYKIATTNNGEEITFNVVCASDESEIEGLIQLHLDFINNPQTISPQEPTQPIQSITEMLQEQQAIITQLQADVAAMKGIA